MTVEDYRAYVRKFMCEPVFLPLNNVLSLTAEALPDSVNESTAQISISDKDYVEGEIPVVFRKSGSQYDL